MTTVDYTDAPIWLQIVIAIAVVVGFLIAVIRGIPPVWKFVTRTVTTINASAELPQFMETTVKTLTTNTALIERLRAQVENSHATNLRDELTSALESTQRTEEQVTALHDKLSDVQGQLKTLSRSDERLWAALEKTRPHTPGRNRPVKSKEQ